MGFPPGYVPAPIINQTHRFGKERAVEPLVALREQREFLPPLR